MNEGDCGNPVQYTGLSVGQGCGASQEARLAASARPRHY